MSHTLHLRKSLAPVLIFSLVLSGLLTIATDQNYASHNFPTPPFTPNVKESSEETASQAEMCDDATRARVSQAIGKLPLSFEENRGQVDKEVKYISRGSGYTLFLTPTEAVLALRRHDGRKVTAASPDARRSRVPAQSRPLRASVLRMKLSGANPAPAVSGESEMEARTNYFIGSDPEKWSTGVARYGRVRYSQVYPGIDMIYYGQQHQLEYDFEVAPRADARQIALEFTGIRQVKIERATGELVLKTADGEVRQRRPVAYQEAGGTRHEVASRYVMKGTRKVGIEVGEYDRARPLVIDPVLSYSSYLGGNDWEFGYGIAVDASGNAYVTGKTDSTNFPKTNQYQTDQPHTDAFVTKINTNLSGAASLLYSTYLGGNVSDVGNAIAVDASGIVYVTGQTSSFDFPTLNEFQVHEATNGADVFVTKLDTNQPGAASLLYSTYLGGNGDLEAGNSIAIDSSGNAYVTGATDSTNFPKLNYYQANQADLDAFVTKINTNASGAASLLYSTYLGGSLNDYGYGIAVDSSGIAYVTGATFSSNFPALDQYQTYQNGGDAFVTKIDTSVSGAASLLYSTFLGGSDGSDSGRGIAIDASGNAYVTGITSSSNFPTLKQYQTDQGNIDAFVAKLNPNLSGAASLLYSTYLGGSDYDVGYGIALSSSTNVYVTGVTVSTDYPTLDEFQTNFSGNGDDDGFVTKLNPSLSGAASLLYSTYLGGGQTDFSLAIAVDSSGNAYVTGYTLSNNFPTLNQYQINQAVADAFITKLKDSYSIRGRVTSNGATGIGGVTVKLGGSESRTTITDGAGNYSFTNLLLGGNYTVTPSKSGLTFIPLKRSFTNLQASQRNVDFTTRRATINGKVTLNTATGAGLSGVTVTLTGGAGFTPRTVKTASNGTYSISNLPTPGNYTIKPSKTGYTFSPVQIVLNNVTGNQTGKNFVATPKTYAISGVVRLGTAGLSGVIVKLTSPTPAGFTPRTATTSSTGAY